MLLDYSKNENYYEKALEEEIKWLGNSFREFNDNLQDNIYKINFTCLVQNLMKLTFENLKKINFVGFVGKDEKSF